MSSPAKKAQSHLPEATSPTAQSPKGNAKSPTPGPASPTPGPASPAAVHAGEPTDLLSGAHWGELEIPDDNDSTLVSDAESSTASITSTILDYRTISGRTYHSDAVTDSEYWGPNDEKANEVLDIFHHAMTLLFDDRLYTAPLSKDIENALDVGTGTGLWAIDFADEFPNCRVVGTDISPIQPSWVPPNLSFNIDDATKEWAFQPDLFDYIHIRWLCGTIKDWPSLYKEAYRCTKPGGWIEHVDGDVNVVCLDGTMPDDSAMNQWGKIWTSVERKTGNVFNIVRTGIMEDGLKEAGFTNVQIEDYLEMVSQNDWPDFENHLPKQEKGGSLAIKNPSLPGKQQCQHRLRLRSTVTDFQFWAPTGPWPTTEKEKQIGFFHYIFSTQDIEGFLNYFLGQVMGWTDKEMANYAAAIRREYKEGKIHGYIKWRVVRAQKPLDA